jgi:superoxide reductase
MTEKKEIYRCDICGNIIEVIKQGAGTLVCCNQPMKILKENFDEKASLEKHVPFIKNKKVKIGEKKHPMEENHFIEWIEAEDEQKNISRMYLRPGDKPEARFKFKVISARAYCNLHGLWKNQI